ncbi:MAG: hypothetical protein ACYC3G_03635 [Minisyncoccota bacterium]
MVLWLKLNGRLRKKLLSLPNNIGTDFQLVDILLKNGRILKRIRVCESRVVELPCGFRNLKESEILTIKLSK